MSNPSDPRFSNWYSWLDHAGEGYHKVQERRTSSFMIGLVVVFALAVVGLLLKHW